MDLSVINLYIYCMCIVNGTIISFAAVADVFKSVLSLVFVLAKESGTDKV